MALRSTNTHEEDNNRTGMSKFTPVFDSVAQELGNTAANVYGVVWRHCQRREGVCRASLAELSRCLGLNKATVMRQLKVLVQQGYVVDATPHARFTPHTYYNTRKACEQEIQPVAQGNETVAKSNESVAQNNAPVAERNESVAESQLKILETIKDTRETGETTRGGALRPPAPSAELALFHAVAEFNAPRQLREDVVAAVHRMGERLGREPTAEDLKPFLKAWVSRGFRANNLAWLFDWAVSGSIPERSERKKGSDGRTQAQTDPGRDGSTPAVADRRSRSTAEPTPEQLAAYERINARRRAAIAALHDVR